MVFFFSVRLCNNKNLSKYNGNITEPFPGNTAPNNYHSSPEFSHELQKAQNISFRGQTVFPLGAQLLSQSLLHYSLRQHNLLSFICISHPFSASFVILSGFVLFFFCFSLTCPVINLFNVQSRKPFPWNIIVICHLYMFFSIPESLGQVDWKISWNIETWWWWWWWRDCIWDLTCSWQGLHLDNKLLLHQANFHWFSCQQLLASALSHTACFGLCAWWS